MTKFKKLLADRVLVEVEVVTETKTQSGLIIPAVNTEEAPMKGKVIQVSTRVSACEVEEDKVEVGDTIIFSKFAGSDVHLNGKAHKVLRITDIFGCIEEDQK